MAIVGSGIFGVIAIYTCKWLFGVDGLEVATLKEFGTRDQLYAARYVQALSSIGAFVFASVAQLAIMGEPLVDGMGLKNKVPARMLLLGAILVFIMQPAISYFATWNLSWHLPASMADLESSLRALHEQAVKTQFEFVKNQTFIDFLFNLLFMAALPAFAEELFFRRVGIQIIFSFTRNAHVSIVISALLFALIHGQFFYLVPLFLFGIVLGYLALWSRSLWLPVLAHFVNNALTVTLTYFSNDPNADEMDLGSPFLIMLLSISLSNFILLQLKKRQIQD